MAFRSLLNSKVSDPRGRGLVLAVDGELRRLWNVIGASWEVITSDRDAVAGGGYLIDARTGNITITLPASAATGDIIGFLDVFGRASTSVLTVAKNGHLLVGADEDLIIDVDYASFYLVYVNIEAGWKIIM